MDAFINEAYRVLKPGGYFAWTDFRDEKTMNSIRTMFSNANFENLKDSDITDEVIQALDEISDQKKSRIQKGTGKIIRRSFETFAGVKGTPVYEAFVKGDIGYYRCLLRK